MQILGKRSKVLLIVVAIVMLVAVGVSFAIWDTSAVNATNGNLSNYANAKVGDVIEFGRYYQTGNKVSDAEDAEYEKTPIEWIVVDKDERTGQLTLMSKYILAAGSYFGNWYYKKDDVNGGYYYNTSGEQNLEVGYNPYNQAYVESTVRAYLNNLERMDMGGDAFTSGIGYEASKISSDKTTGFLRSSVGFSNKKYWTGLTTLNDSALVEAGNKGFLTSGNDIYYQRPINNIEYINRPATRGFIDEAFSDDEQSQIVPKSIAGYTGYRWPDDSFDISTKSYVNGALDKVWLASVTELNVENGQDWNGDINDAWTNPSDETGSVVFEYFKNYRDYGFNNVAEAVKAERTVFAKNSYASNFSIPVYKYQSTEINTDIHATNNSSNHYVTRSPSSPWYDGVRIILNSGRFSHTNTPNSNLGVRPCIILKY